METRGKQDQVLGKHFPNLNSKTNQKSLRGAFVCRGCPTEVPLTGSLEEWTFVSSQLWELWVWDGVLGCFLPGSWMPSLLPLRALLSAPFRVLIPLFVCDTGAFPLWKRTV